MRRIIILLIAALIASPLPISTVSAASTWSTIGTFDTQAPLSNTLFDVAVSSDGNVITQFWVNNGRPTVRTSIDGGATWGAERTFGFGDIQRVTIVMSADGTKQFAFWAKTSGITNVLYGLRSTDSGATWPSANNATTLGTDVTPLNIPQFAISQDGSHVVAAWEMKPLGTNITSIVTRTTTNGGDSWGKQLTQQTAGSSGSTPRVAISANGNTAVLSYLRIQVGQPAEYIVHTSVFGGVIWNKGTKLSAALADARTPRIALSADGTVIYSVWSNINRDGTGRVAMRVSKDSGTSWNPEVQLSDQTTSPYSTGIVTSSDGTRATLTWSADVNPAPVFVRSTANTGTSFGNVYTLRNSLKYQTTELAANANATSLVVASAPVLPTTGPVQVSFGVNGGSSWSSAVDLATPTGQSSFPRVVLSADGTTTFVQTPTQIGNTVTVTLAKSTTATSDAEQELINGGGINGGEVIIPVKSDQIPVPALVTANTLKRKGTTKVVSRRLVTNAGQLITPRLTAVVKKTGNAAKPRDFKVIMRANYVRVHLSGRKSLLVTLQLTSPETDTYTAYQGQKVYRVKAKR